MLARNAGRVLTHRTLLTEVWGDRQPANTQPLRTAITTLRKKLDVGPTPSDARHRSGRRVPIAPPRRR